MTIHAFSSGQWRGALWSGVTGLLYLVAGGLLAFFPLRSILALTIVLSALFLAEGIVEIILAFRIRPQKGWGWFGLSGISALAVGILIALQLPSSATWTLGVLTGVNMLMTGWSFVFLALAGHREDTAHAVAA